jgi:hypothetical protein
LRLCHAPKKSLALSFRDAAIWPIGRILKDIFRQVSAKNLCNARIVIGK